MQVFEQLVRILTDGKAKVSDAGSDEALQESREAWQTDTLARLRAFGRRWHVALASLTPQLDSAVFADDTTLPEVRAAALEMLYL